jgi:hypothetical protein
MLASDITMPPPAPVGYGPQQGAGFSEPLQPLPHQQTTWSQSAAEDRDIRDIRNAIEASPTQSGFRPMPMDYLGNPSNLGRLGSAEQSTVGDMPSTPSSEQGWMPLNLFYDDPTLSAAGVQQQSGQSFGSAEQTAMGPPPPLGRSQQEARLQQVPPNYDQPSALFGFDHRPHPETPGASYLRESSRHESASFQADKSMLAFLGDYAAGAPIRERGDTPTQDGATYGWLPSSEHERRPTQAPYSSEGAPPQAGESFVSRNPTMPYQQGNLGGSIFYAQQEQEDNDLSEVGREGPSAAVSGSTARRQALRESQTQGADHMSMGLQQHPGGLSSSSQSSLRPIQRPPAGTTRRPHQQGSTYSSQRQREGEPSNQSRQHRGSQPPGSSLGR